MNVYSQPPTHMPTYYRYSIKINHIQNVNYSKYTVFCRKCNEKWNITHVIRRRVAGAYSTEGTYRTWNNTELRLPMWKYIYNLMNFCLCYVLCTFRYFSMLYEYVFCYFSIESLIEITMLFHEDVCILSLITVWYRQQLSHSFTNPFVHSFLCTCIKWWDGECWIWLLCRVISMLCTCFWMLLYWKCENTNESIIWILKYFINCFVFLIDWLRF